MKYILLALLLAGCSTGPVLPTVTRVPVPVPCVEEMPRRPEITADAAILAMPDYSAVLSIWRDRLALRDYAGELEATLAGCQ